MGLRCWDASGRLVVDLGDYNIRYVGSVASSIAAGSTISWAVAFSGMRSTGWLVVPQDYDTSGYGQNIVYCIPGSNAFTVNFLPVGAHRAYSFTFDVYKWDA